MPRIRRTGLWAHRGFALLWTGQSVSRLGSEVTLVALPLTAIMVLRVSPTQMGLLMAAGYLPAAAIGLLAGAWVDRVRRRMLLIACQITLGLTTLTVPIAAWAGVLRFEHLLVLQAINGTLTVIVTAAGHAFMPGLVGTNALAEANAKLATTSSVARVSGPALAGVLVQALSAPVAILADALSFLFSAVCVVLIRNTELAVPRKTGRSVSADIKEGLYLVLGHRLLRPVVLALAIYNFFAALFTGMYTLFMVQELGVDPALVGAVFACGGIGGVMGGVVAAPMMRRIGTTRSLVVGAVMLAVMHVVAPFAGGPAFVAAVVLAGAGVFAQLGFAVLQVAQTTLMQRLIPAHALGRVSASRQVLGLAAVPIGFALGGVLGDSLGLRPAIAVGAVGTLIAAGMLLRSPLWSATEDQIEAPTIDEAQEPPLDGPVSIHRRGVLRRVLLARAPQQG